MLDNVEEDPDEDLLATNAVEEEESKPEEEDESKPVDALVPMTILDMCSEVEEEKVEEVKAVQPKANKVETPQDIIFGKQVNDFPCNQNIYNALKTHQITRNGKPYWPFTLSNEMHLANMTFEEA